MLCKMLKSKKIINLKWVISLIVFFKLGDKNTEIRKIKLKLIKIGYKCSQDNNFSRIISKLVISRKFNQEEINTINDLNDADFSNVFKYN